MGVVFASLLICAGLFLMGLGAFGVLYFRAERKRLVPVELLVTDVVMHRDSEDERHYAAVYRVRSGLHKGKQGESFVADVQPLHKEGDIVDGWLDPRGDRLTSAADQMHQKWMPLWAIVIGASLCCVAALWFQLR